MSTEVKPFWAAAVLKMATRGAVTVEQIGTVRRHKGEWAGRGYDFARALEDAYRKGYFEEPGLIEGWYSKKPATLTEAGRAKLEEYIAEGNEGAAR